MSASDPRRNPYSFSLTEGGPFQRLMVRLHLARPKLRIWWPSVVTWLPLALVAAYHIGAGEPVDRTVFDLSVHTRLLVSLPAMMLGERLLEAQVRGAIGELYVGHLAEASALDAIVARGERLRDSVWGELVVLALAITGSQLVLWGPLRMFQGGVEVSGWTFSRLWYGLVAVLLFDFVMYRWLWRWAIWCYMLVRIARLPLAGIATHPDCAAGLSPLSWPTTGFASFVFALAAALAGAWGTQLLAHHTTLAALWPGLLAFMIVSSVIACGPLLMFIGHLFRARRQTLARYAELARVYTERFHAKWIERPDTAGELLGTEDIQSLASLGTSFHIIENTRMFPFGPRKLIELWLAALLPMLPLVAGSVTTEELMRRFASTILGGIPI